MGSRDVWSNSETTTTVKNAGKGGSASRKPAGSSGILLLGAIVLAAIILSAGVIVLGIIAGALIYQESRVDATGDEWGDNTDGTPASPTIIVRPDVSPDMSIPEKLTATDPIVGQWKSIGVIRDGHTYPLDIDHFSLTIYNDNTFIIYDRPNETYVTGEWEKMYNTPYYNNYSAVEPGRVGPVYIVGQPNLLLFNYFDGEDITYSRG